MANDIAFIQWWHDYEVRTDQSEQIAYKLAELLPIKKLHEATKILTVGPASAKIEKMLVSEVLPNVKTCYAVEPCPNFMNNLINIMDRLGVQTIPYRQTVQDFAGTPEQVDLILMTHVAYYFHRDFRPQLKKLMNLLSPGGALIFATKDDCIENHNLVSLLPPAAHSADFSILPSVKKFRSHMEALGLKREEIVIQHSLDISNTGWGDQSFVSLLINRPVLKSEVRAMCRKARCCCEEGSEKLKLNDRLFILKN